MDNVDITKFEVEQTMTLKEITTLITGSGQIEITKKFGWNYPLDMD